MITLSNGHWKSIRTEEEEEASLQNQINSMCEETRVCVEQMLEDYRTTGKSKLADMAAEELWEVTPVPIEEWLDNPDLSGEAAGSLHPVLRDDMIELFREPFFSDRYHEIIFTGALGVGKTYWTSLCVMRICYELLCLKCPQTALGLSPSDPLYIIPVSRTKELARRVAFGQIAGKLNLSPFFRPRMKETKEEIWFPEKRIFIMGGASNESHALGMNVVCSFVDEGNFFSNNSGANLAIARPGEEEGYDKAQTIYDALARRIKSRFERVGVSGMMFLVSSKRGFDDFTERRIRECRDENNPGVFVRDYASWEVKPDAYEHSKWYRMAFSQVTGRNRYLEEEEDPVDGEIELKFPEEFKGHFDKNPMGAAQDYGGISFEAADTFFTDREVIEKMMDYGREHPFKSYDWQIDKRLPIEWDKLVQEDVNKQLIPICCPNAVRHVHIDISKNRCATGFCVGHRCGTQLVTRVDPESGKLVAEEAPVIHIDFVLRIIAPPGGEIEHAKVRGVVFALMKKGVNVRSVTMDRYCSTPNLQQFERAGLKAKELSTVMKLDPYLYLRSACKEGRVQSPYYPLLRKELRSLVPSPDGNKVLKGPGASKDLADALAGVVFWLATQYKDTGPLMPSRGMVADSQPKGGWEKGDYVWADEKSEEEEGMWGWIS